MSDEMYLLPQITHYPLLIARDPSLITVLPSLITHYSSVDEVAKWAGAFKDDGKEK
jgi:hypothetical protein